MCSIFSVELRFGVRLSHWIDKVESAPEETFPNGKSEQEKYQQHVNFSLFSSITASRFWGRAIQTNDDDVDSEKRNERESKKKETTNNNNNDDDDFDKKKN